MKTYLIQIGNMNAQFNYKVRATSAQGARKSAITRHKELGRGLDGCKVYIVRSY